MKYVDPSGYCHEIGGSAFATRKIGSDGVLYTLDGNVAWDYYIAWRNKDKMAFDKMANSGKMKNKDQELIMRMTLSIFAHMDDGSLMLALSSNGQQGLAKGIMQKSGAKVAAKVAAKVTPKVAPKVAPKTAPKVASQGTGESVQKNTGKAKNFMKSDPEATGDHTVLKRDPKTNEVTNYETYKSNPLNPSGFDKVQRFDGIGKGHINKITKQNVPTPHVNGKSIPGGVREAYPNEIPRKR